MFNSKNTKRSLLMSALALVLCLSMLVGSTFAWFTDTASTSVNKIQSGTLDIQLLMQENDQWVSAEGKTLNFISANGNQNILWEPGCTYELPALKVVNKGNLELKYQIHITGIEGDAKLLEVIDFTIEGENALNGTLAPNAETPEITLIGSMAKDANNDYMGLTLEGIAITVVATQMTAEFDSVDNQYDAEATYPAVAVSALEEGATKALSLCVGDVTVDVPASAPAGLYKMVVGGFEVTTDAQGVTKMNTEIELMKDGQAVTDDAATYNVNIKLDPMAQNHRVFHKDTEITDYTYDAFTGIISFETTSFSPFCISYDVFGTDVVVDEANKAIHSGYFTGVNPADIDPSLRGDSSEYIAVDYVKDGVKHYIVSQRATTVILGDNDDGGSGYTFENGNYPVKMVNDNALYSIISGLQGNAHSTVYLLPGTYEENTAINVYSNMDIIGLGNAEDIKIIKVKGSYSNRHLFNCNGAVTRDEHIQVTIRNLYLDASAKNLNSAGKFYLTDNAAVQAIRLSKVKCYDLVIAKSGGYPFYVNGKYDTRGAFMYVENCSTTSNSVVDTAAPFLFYYNNLTCGNGAYTTNTSYIKPCEMALNDWEW